jgi:hypothetical protein
VRQREAHHRFIEGEEIHAQSYVLTNVLTRFCRIISAWMRAFSRAA